MNLEQLVEQKIEQLGESKAAKYFGVTNAVLANWKKGRTKIPASAAQKIVDEGNIELPEEKPVIKTEEDSLQPSGLMWEGKKLIIGFPCYKNTNPDTMYSIVSLLAKHHGKVGLDMEIGTLIIQARNTIATRFMKSKAEWLLFLDDDMLFPCANPAVFNGRWNARMPEIFANTDVVTKLISHGQPLVGGLYFGRDPKGVAQYGEAFEYAHENDYAHNAPYNELRPVKWMGTGCMLIHRSVFEAMQKKYPECNYTAPGRTCGFFTPLTPDQGEDVSFCLRAKECGFQPKVDMSLICGHIGNMAFWHHNTNNTTSNR